MAAFYSGDRIDAVVVDIGSAATKIGWAGDDYPRSYFRSNVAALRDKDRRIQQQVKYDYFSHPILPDGTDGEWDTVNPIDPVTGLLYDANLNKSSGSTAATSGSMNSNNNNGGSTKTATTTTPDWCELVQQFIQHGYEKSLSGSSPSDHPLIMVERSYNPPATRQMMMECLFEDLNVPATFLAKDAVLSCYGTGRTSAIVVDLGYSGTTVTPVYDGYVESKGIRRNPGAGLATVDEMIVQNLDKLYHKKKKQKNTYTVMPLYQLRAKNHKMRKPNIHTATRMFMARECRDCGAGATINTATSSTNGGANTGTTGAALNTTAAANVFHAPSKPFELPDGTTIDVPSIDRFRVADIMYGMDAASQQIRDAKFADVQSKLGNYMDWMTSTTSSADDGDESKEQLAKEAVGIVVSGRNNPRSSQRRGQPPAVTTNTNTRRPRRTAAAWQRACLPQLQTLLDEQMTSAPLATMVCDAAYRCDRDQQAILLGNVVVSGGGACLGPTEQAVPDCVRDTIEAVIHQHTPGWRVKVLTPALNERAILPWLGGSILGSLGTFHEMYITKAEYEEWGPAIVNRKCP